MADSTKNENTASKSSHSLNEIDDFTQKLLDKKVELTLFPDEEEITSSQLQGSMNEAQRKNAETSMLNALDQMRKERGQSTIEEEESNFRTGQHQEAAGGEQTSGEEDDFVSVDPNRYETHHREDHFEKQEKRPPRQKLTKKPKFWIITSIAALVVLMFAGYVWKVEFYDPAHQTNTQQTEAYDRLVSYADEYPMMSDSQKKEILKLEADYNSLPAAKKEEINAYFANPKHTGQTFTDLLAQTKQAGLLAENPGLAELQDYARNYNSYSQAQKDDIVNRLDAYNALNEGGKAQINADFVTAAGSDFMTLYNEAKSRLDSQTQPASSQPAAPDQEQPPAAVDENSAYRQQLSDQLDQLIIDRQNYVYFLNAEEMPVEGDEILAQYDAQIAQVQAELSALGSN